MADMNLTRQQLAAVEHREGALLVSAAAGSGKTSILIEHVLRRIEEGAQIDRFLIISYTRAAAAELRSRITDRLAERLSDDVRNASARRQLLLAHSADIGTIHFICGKLVREYAQKLGVSPDFRIAEQDECDIIRSRVLEDLLEERYAAIEENEGFSQLTELLVSQRGDEELERVVMETHDALRSHPRPELWARENMGGAGGPDDTVWGALLCRTLEERVEYCIRGMERAVAVIEADEKLSRSYYDSFAATAGALRALREALESGWDAAVEKAGGLLPFPRLKPLQKYGDEEKKNAVKDIRSRCENECRKLREILSAPAGTLRREMEAVQPAMDELLRIVTELDRRYLAEKRRRSVMDFGDLEHGAVDLLTEPDGSPSELAAEVGRRYDLVVVDEYQDVNRLQEMIFSALSGGGERLFMVGDVRQSIYRFRLADPGVFLGKYHAFAAGNGGTRILLSDNFRSRGGVIRAVNTVFSAIMSEKAGELQYGEDEQLRQGLPESPEDAEPFELDVLDMSRSEEPDADKVRAEADFVAARLRRIHDEKGFAYGDMAVLLRTKGKMGQYEEALRRLGIPVAGGMSAKDLFETPEAEAVLSILSAVDNPRSDVPLIAMLRSPLYSFTEDELARIRTALPQGDFYDALKAAAEHDGRCAEFLEELKRLRQEAADERTDRLLYRLYGSRGAFGIYGAMPGGEERVRNLRKIGELAERFEAEGHRGVFGFVRHIEALRERGRLEVESAGRSDGVSVMSIHRSKGLEFPVVVLADLGHLFNMQDLRRPVLVHPRLGIACNYRDSDRMIEYSTAKRDAIAGILRNELISEEMRILYVAMTRAREKLIGVCTVQDAAKAFGRLRADAQLPMDPQAVLDARSFGDWLMTVSLLADDWDVRVEKPERTEAAPEAEREIEPEGTEEIAARLSFEYGYSVSGIPSKLTATEVRGYIAKEAAEEAQQAGPRAGHVFRRPAFALDDSGLTAAEKGIAAHKVMQLLDFGACTSREGVEKEIERLCEKKLIRRQEAEAVSARQLFSFFVSPVGRRLARSKDVRREFKFSLLADAGRWFPGGSGEQILLQGVIDCFFEEDGEWVIVDFKTDRVDGEALAARAAEYAPQLETYAFALERMTGRRAKETLLYFLPAQKGIAV